MGGKTSSASKTDKNSKPLENNYESHLSQFSTSCDQFLLQLKKERLKRNRELFNQSNGISSESCETMKNNRWFNLCYSKDDFSEPSPRRSQRMRLHSTTSSSQLPEWCQELRVQLQKHIQPADHKHENSTPNLCWAEVLLQQFDSIFNSKEGQISDELAETSQVVRVNPPIMTIQESNDGSIESSKQERKQSEWLVCEGQDSRIGKSECGESLGLEQLESEERVNSNTPTPSNREKAKTHPIQSPSKCFKCQDPSNSPRIEKSQLETTLQESLKAKSTNEKTINQMIANDYEVFEYELDHVFERRSSTFFDVSMRSFSEKQFLNSLSINNQIYDSNQLNNSSFNIHNSQFTKHPHDCRNHINERRIFGCLATIFQQDTIIESLQASKEIRELIKKQVFSNQYNLINQLIASFIQIIFVSIQSVGSLVVIESMNIQQLQCFIAEDIDSLTKCVRGFIEVLVHVIPKYYDFWLLEKVYKKGHTLLSEDVMWNFSANVVLEFTLPALQALSVYPLIIERIFTNQKVQLLKSKEKFESLKLTKPEFYKVKDKFCLNELTLQYIRKSIKQQSKVKQQVEQKSLMKNEQREIDVLLNYETESSNNYDVDLQQEIEFPFGKCVGYLRELQQERRPLYKLRLIVQAFEGVQESVHRFYLKHGCTQRLCLGPEDLMDITVYILAKSQAYQVQSEIQFIRSFITEKAEYSEKTGYYLLTLEAALSYIIDTDFDMNDANGSTRLSLSTSFHSFVASEKQS